MATRADPLALAAQARQIYLDVVLRGVPLVVPAVVAGVKVLASQVVDPAESLKRRDLVLDLPKAADRWQRKVLMSLQAARTALQAPGTGGANLPKGFGAHTDFALVDDDTIEREILGSRMALALMDAANWEFSDLRSRLAVLEHKDELDTHDVLRPHVLSKYTVEGWLAAGLDMAKWRTAQSVLHKEFAGLVEEAYHETNRWLLEHGVRPEIDLRPMIRKSTSAVATAGGDAQATSSSAGELRTGAGGGTQMGGTVMGGGGARATGMATGMASGMATSHHRGGPAASMMAPVGGAGEETRLMTRNAGMGAAGSQHAEAVLGRLNRLIAKHVPEFGRSTTVQPQASPKLRAAIADAQNSLQARLNTAHRGGASVNTPQLLQDLQQRKQALKEAAQSPVERATIEIVALMFQAILQEERIPAAVRVWFARLQMPVLRVAVSEPDFFATTDHPARKLIDRMGACVMGFESSARAVGDALEKEVRRIVQVVEAYPDTGRRVFQTVLTEFEKFLERYFQSENDVTRHGVSLAQQVEQRETLAVQYTIELRRMLEGVPVQDGVREFLFKVWADVLATFAVKHGNASEHTKTMKKAATDLIWSASAKVSREERADVIRRLPPLLKTLRLGMAEAGVGAEEQDRQIQALNDSLAAAFTAKAEAIPPERMQELTLRLEALEEVLPDDFELDESMVLDLSGYEASGLEVVADGGSMPTPAMLSWAHGLQVGTWFMLDYRGRNESVQLAWQGMRKNLSLFVTNEGRGILFQHHRLASFLQAGLLVPAQEEALTVKATRDAMAKLDADPERLLH